MSIIDRPSQDGRERKVEKEHWGTTEMNSTILDAIRTTGAFDDVNLHAVDAIRAGGDLGVIRQQLAPVLERIQQLEDPFMRDRVMKEMVKMSIGKSAGEDRETVSAIIKVINGQDVPVPGAHDTGSPFGAKAA